MTAELINLRRARKRRARTAAETAAEANRLTHGVSTAQKRLASARRAQADKRLDGHRVTEGDAPLPDPRD